MCTMIAEKIQIAGSGKSAERWFPIAQTYVSFDHPFHLQREHALNLDFVNEARGTGARVAVELTPEDARALATTILRLLDEGSRAEAGDRAAADPATT